jgi:hypothetical protein
VRKARAQAPQGIPCKLPCKESKRLLWCFERKGPSLMTEPSGDLIAALRQADGALAAELATAEDELSNAERRAEAVRERYRTFKAQLDDVCAASGIAIADVLVRDTSSRQPDEVVAHRVAGVVPNPIALPCRPQSQRWYAGQALYQLGGEASIAAIAERMRELGYEHGRAPTRRHQLEQSLAALPSQVTWVTSGERPGHLRLRRT